MRLLKILMRAAQRLTGLDSVRENVSRLFETGCFLPLYPALKSLLRNSAVPPGLDRFIPLFPALKRWAIISRPFGTEFWNEPSHSFEPTVSFATASEALGYLSQRPFRG